jgi:RNA-directed DNA polymerase
MLYDDLEASLQLKGGQISILLHLEEADRYTRISPPRSKRQFWKPCNDLRLTQQKIHRMMAQEFTPHPVAHAYVKGKSILTNAQQHVGKRFLFHLDLVNFFGSITKDRVIHHVWQLLPLLEKGSVEALANLCCRAGFLPQGAPTSPILSNLVCAALDEQLQEMAQFLGCKVTRYSDDICFSTDAEVIPPALAEVWRYGPSQRVKLGDTLRVLIESHGFAINHSKLRVQTKDDRQQVTGLIVNERLNVPSEFRSQIRDTLYRWEKYGVTVAAGIYHPHKSVEGFINSLHGRIAYLGQVAGKSDVQYQQFKQSFASLLFLIIHLQASERG